MEALYQSTNFLLQKVQHDLGRLEGTQNEQDAQVVVQCIYGDVITLKENCQTLDNYVSREPPARRQAARMRVDQLRADVHRVDMAVSAVHTRMTQRWRAATERDELLRTRYRPNDTALSIGDHELLLNDRLQSSHTHLDDLISQGSAVLENLKSQHLNLRGVGRKMHEIGQALGLSNSTLQVIDRRVREDWILFVIGCIVCCIFMYAFYRFWRG
ncbi:Golgi SNAP receptor complex member 2 homolog memb-1 [Caenorhabditis elegans]|uniref:Golgi SNAP receptor complex member 2 homolog memb-1 n=1 Tax=Caenorhabditis elegans TaxID=6239 RepID=GOSR2_CAEEL|nr:Golgi SNAP receptor complex member 2 homolog memb-1 [Caenorhabditis elegans]P41941.1 RecName: Full=Golgi SNAP receptor complex member 2 homolog memb-1 [Caenorhabditis elegans]CAA86311.1 Golgi SNAP receptor complex member 2 homolog memb-1 [Caenorhabditis elegans]|eukprot:NP_509586.1 Golgi SNAP receptor complex member 2 homolog memb-1 [Caenorhabditis elegans]